MPKKKKTTRRRVKTYRAAEIVAFISILDGLFGAENIMKLDFRSAIAELVGSISDPAARDGLMDDLINAGINYATVEMVGKLMGTFLGKRPGMTVGSVRVSL